MLRMLVRVSAEFDERPTFDVHITKVLGQVSYIVSGSVGGVR